MTVIKSLKHVNWSSVQERFTVKIGGKSSYAALFQNHCDCIVTCPMSMSQETKLSTGSVWHVGQCCQFYWLISSLSELLMFCKLDYYDYWCLQLLIGRTVFRRPQNFEPSCGICPFPLNFDIAMEFCGILQKLRNDQWFISSSALN